MQVKSKKKSWRYCLLVGAIQLAVIVIGFLIFSAPPARQFAGDAGPISTERGVAYEPYRVREVPWAIHVLRIDRTRTDLELMTTMGGGSTLGLSGLTGQLRSIPSDWGRPVAAINGDFYRREGESYAGDPRGLQILGGELVSGPIERACFWVDAKGVPRTGEVSREFAVTWPDGSQTPFGLNEEREGNMAVLYSSAVGSSTGTSGGTEYVLERVSDSPWLPLAPGRQYQARIRRVRGGGNTPLKPDILVLSISGISRFFSSRAAVGDMLKISTATSPDLRGVKTAIGGGPVLVRDGQARPGRVSRSMERHPRSAIGWNQKEFLFVEVDGRQYGWSMGMTLPELAEYMAKLGCQEAVGLDGGGSAELWFNGRIVNRPCDGHERRMANTLILVEKQKPEKPEKP